MVEKTDFMSSEQNEEQKIVSAGKPIVGNFIMPDTQGTGDEGDGGEGDGDGGAGGEGNGGEGGGTGAGASAGEGSGAAELDDEKLIQALKDKGISFEGSIEDLKKKFEPEAPKPVDETDEEKAKKATAFEKRMLDHYIENGGTPEDFVALKAVASADLKSLSEYQIKKELKDEGFTDDQINAVLVERYYQLNPDEIEKGEGESDEDFTARVEAVKKKVAFGSKKLESKGSFIKKQAEDALSSLRLAIESKDLLEKKEAEFSSNVDEIVSKVPRKVTFELGKIEDIDIAPVQFEVTDDVIASVVETLKDPVKRNQFFYQDNQLNIANIANVMIRNQYLEKALKAVYLEAGDRQVKEFEKVFPGRNANEVGVGGNKAGNNGKKGVIVKAGKPQVAVRQN